MNESTLEEESKCKLQMDKKNEWMNFQINRIVIYASVKTSIEGPRW